MAERKTIAIDAIRRDGGTQTRAGVNEERVVHRVACVSAVGQRGVLIVRRMT